MSLNRKKYNITVQGKENSWGFEFYGDSKNLDQWQKDGLEVDEIIDSIPVVAVRLRLTKPWVFFQDVWNFRNPFK